jgi:pimeloyl-ACP methyl ester carboxylesterase
MTAQMAGASMSGGGLATMAPSDHRLEANGQKLHVLHLGSGEQDRAKVVMIHGLVVDNLSSFYYTIANAVALHAEVYLYDLRGHGLSTIPDGRYRVADHLADLLALLAGWGIDEPVHLVGNSYGGLIALELARRHPRLVASMLLIEAHFPIEGWGEQMADTVGLAAYGIDNESTQRWLAENATRKQRRLVARANRLAKDTSFIDDLVAEEPFPIEALTAISCPVTAVYGQHSDIIERGRDLQRHIPQARLHLVAGAEHGLLHEEPGAVRDHAVTWISGARGAADRLLPAATTDPVGPDRQG